MCGQWTCSAVKGMGKERPDLMTAHRLPTFPWPAISEEKLEKSPSARTVRRVQAEGVTTTGVGIRTFTFGSFLMLRLFTLILSVSPFGRQGVSTSFL